MDSSFIIRPPASVAQSRAVRDPVPVRGAVDTDLIGDRSVSATGDNDTERGHKDGGQSGKDNEPRHDHAPQDLVADPNSRDVIYRERDVRAVEREHPDHALLRLRAYRPAAAEPAVASDNDPHADIRA